MINQRLNRVNNYHRVKSVSLEIEAMELHYVYFLILNLSYASRDSTNAISELHTSPITANNNEFYIDK